MNLFLFNSGLFRYPIANVGPPMYICYHNYYIIGYNMPREILVLIDNLGSDHGDNLTSPGTPTGTVFKSSSRITTETPGSNFPTGENFLLFKS